MRRSTLLPAAVAAVAAALLAGCTHDTAPAAGAGASPASDPARPSTSASVAAGSSASRSGSTTTDRTHRGTSVVDRDPDAPTGPVSAPSAYLRARVDIPQQPSGYATVEVPVPAGWTAHATGSGVGWWSRVGQVDRRDPSARLLLRIRNQPATGETDDGSLRAVIADYRALPGATVVVSNAPHQASIGLREADWTVDVPVGGRPRVAQVSAWALNGQVITVYASGPADSGRAVRALHDHAADLRIWTHIGPEAG
jgi:hypothetical protein